MSQLLDSGRQNPVVHTDHMIFFVQSYSHTAYLNYGGVHFVHFPSAVRAVTALCKLPFALRLGLSQDLLRAKEITKEKESNERERKKRGTKEKGSLVFVCG